MACAALCTGSTPGHSTVSNRTRAWWCSVPLYLSLRSFTPLIIALSWSLRVSLLLSRCKLSCQCQVQAADSALPCLAAACIQVSAFQATFPSVVVDSISREKVNLLRPLGSPTRGTTDPASRAPPFVVEGSAALQDLRSRHPPDMQLSILVAHTMQWRTTSLGTSLGRLEDDLREDECTRCPPADSCSIPLCCSSCSAGS